MVGTSMPCTETIDGWIPGIDAQPRTPKEEINAPPTPSKPDIKCLCLFPFEHLIFCWRGWEGACGPSINC